MTNTYYNLLVNTSETKESHVASTKQQRLLFELTHFYLRAQKKTMDTIESKDPSQSAISQEN
jgi:hypothetical protein